MIGGAPHCPETSPASCGQRNGPCPWAGPLGEATVAVVHGCHGDPEQFHKRLVPPDVARPRGMSTGVECGGEPVSAGAAHVQGRRGAQQSTVSTCTNHPLEPERGA